MYINVCVENSKCQLLASDEAYELRYAFLDCVLGVLSNLPVGRQSLLHDPAYVGDREVPVLLANVGPRALIAAALVGGTPRTIRHCRRNPTYRQNIVSPTKP